MSKREFVIGAPMRQTTVNSRDEDEMNQAVELLAEKLAPMVAKLLEGEGKEPATNAGSNGRKLNPSDITSRYQLPDGDEFDTLPPGDSPGGASTPADGYELPD